MRPLFAVLLACAITACAAEAQPNPFPETAKQEFLEQCRGGEAFCACSWDGITRAMTAEEWDAALVALDETGHPHPQMIIVSSRCRDQTR